VSERQKEAAIFDVDHTLLRGSTGAAFLLEAFKAGIIPLSLVFRVPIEIVKYRFGIFSFQDIGKKMLPIRGMAIEKLEHIARGRYRQLIQARLFSQALQRIEEERNKGRIIILASSSLDILIAPIVEATKADHFVATRLQADEFGLCTGDFIEGPAFGKGKLHKVDRLLRELEIPVGICSFYSDSMYDLPLLDKVKDPQVVNPDRALRRIARKRSWRIHRFRV
jgi:HAD superfamily hydrolase (TIGR01490 family)